MTEFFEEFDLSNFWDDSDYSLEEYVDEYPTDDIIASIEKEIGGYKLPKSYIYLMKKHNGGIPKNTCFPTKEPSGWADDHIAITGIMGIGHKKTYSINGDLGSNFMIQEWGYPEIGVCIADTPSAGHEMVMLDYSSCGKQGEPQVVYVDQENDYSIIVLAKDFETFIKGLVNEEKYDTSEQDKLDNLEIVRRGTFSPILLKAFPQISDKIPDIEYKIRRLAEAIVQEKGYFTLHADDQSLLMYDLIFYLYSSYNTAESYNYYVNYPKIFETSYDNPSYPLMIAFGIVGDQYSFCTGGYSLEFIEDWWKDRISKEFIIKQDQGFRPSYTMESYIIKQLQKYS